MGRLKTGDRMPARKSTTVYGKKRKLTAARPQRLGIALDATDMAILGRLQARRFKANGGRILGPTALIRECLVIADNMERAAENAA